ncbi:MAG: DNA repair protein RecO [Phycisphaeraceae bacterium]|nr:DNA repair protein RecO [Phycisphaeraceae bacterium]MCW5755324.1 DNA repair protein RecO [Phycisphaeraceae bacterium]
MPAIREEALCLRTWEWSETSQTACLFTEGRGILKGLAKGSRRERSPFGGGFELLTRGELLAIAKPAGQLTTFTAWDLIEPFRPLRSALPAFYAGLYLADVTMHMLSEADPHPAAYSALLLALRSLNQPLHTMAIVAWFQWRLLEDAGYRPDLLHLVGTSTPTPDEGTLIFDPTRGGFLLDAQSGPSQRPPWRMRVETLQFLRVLDSSLAPENIPNPADPSANRSARFLAAWIREITGVDLPTYPPLFGT